LIPDGDFEPIPEAVETIRTIFDLKLLGFGMERIAKRLNADASWTPPHNPKRRGPGWRPSYVQKILQNRSVLGEYQLYRQEEGKRVPDGEPISDYFPQIIEPETFHAVQAAFEANRGKGGRKGQAANLFVHIAKCGYCGGSMVMADKGSERNGGKRLVCRNAMHGVCDDSGRKVCGYRSVKYDETERTILENCRRLRPEQVLPRPDEQARLCQSLRQRIQGGQAESRDIGEQVANLADQIARTKSRAMRDRYEARAIELQERLAAIEEQIAEDERELRKAEAGLQSFTRWKRDLASLQRGIAEDDAVELRLRLRAHLREIIDRIEVFAVGFRKRYDAEEEERTPENVPRSERRKARAEYLDSVEDFAEYVDALCEEYYPDGTSRKGPYWRDGQLRLPEDTERFYRFLEYLTQRRMSKEGRFLRVHFKTGARVDLVPGGSLASGMELVKDGRRKDGWRFVSPDIDRLWREFATRNPGELDCRR
jgi:hypothetical protein